MTEARAWETIKAFYKDKFGIDGWVVEMFANMDVLLLCVSGASNHTISEFLDIDDSMVTAIIKDTFNFDGWEKDLPLNPYKIYCDGLASFRDYEYYFRPEIDTILASYKAFEYIDIAELYLMCETFHDIEERIEHEWI